MPNDRAKLELVAAKYNDLMTLQMERRKLEARMIRACLHRIENANGRACPYNEGIKGLHDLAKMLEETR